MTATRIIDQQILEVIDSAKNRLLGPHEINGFLSSELIQKLSEELQSINFMTTDRPTDTKSEKSKDTTSSIQYRMNQEIQYLQNFFQLNTKWSKRFCSLYAKELILELLVKREWSRLKSAKKFTPDSMTDATVRQIIDKNISRNLDETIIYQDIQDQIEAHVAASNYLENHALPQEAKKAVDYQALVEEFSLLIKQKEAAEKRERLFDDSSYNRKLKELKAIIDECNASKFFPPYIKQKHLMNILTELFSQLNARSNTEAKKASEEEMVKLMTPQLLERLLLGKGSINFNKKASRYQKKGANFIKSIFNNKFGFSTNSDDRYPYPLIFVKQKIYNFLVKSHSHTAGYDAATKSMVKQADSFLAYYNEFKTQYEKVQTNAKALANSTQVPQSDKLETLAKDFQFEISKEGPMFMSHFTNIKPLFFSDPLPNIPLLSRDQLIELIILLPAFMAEILKNVGENSNLMTRLLGTNSKEILVQDLINKRDSFIKKGYSFEKKVDELIQKIAASPLIMTSDIFINMKENLSRELLMLIPKQRDQSIIKAIGELATDFYTNDANYASLFEKLQAFKINTSLPMKNFRKIIYEASLEEVSNQFNLLIRPDKSSPLTTQDLIAYFQAALENFKAELQYKKLNSLTPEILDFQNLINQLKQDNLTMNQIILLIETYKKDHQARLTNKPVLNEQLNKVLVTLQAETPKSSLIESPPMTLRTKPPEPSTPRPFFASGTHPNHTAPQKTTLTPYIEGKSEDNKFTPNSTRTLAVNLRVEEQLSKMTQLIDPKVMQSSQLPIINEIKPDKIFKMKTDNGIYAVKRHENNLKIYAINIPHEDKEILGYAYAQIAAFVNIKGPHAKIYLGRCTDSKLIRAYNIICQGNGLTLIPESKIKSFELPVEYRNLNSDYLEKENRVQLNNLMKWAETATQHLAEADSRLNPQESVENLKKILSRLKEDYQLGQAVVEKFPPEARFLTVPHVQQLLTGYQQTIDSIEIMLGHSYSGSDEMVAGHDHNPKSK